MGFSYLGGEKGIRTLEAVARLHAFQACQLNHSCISPLSKLESFLNKVAEQVRSLHRTIFPLLLVSNAQTVDFAPWFVSLGFCELGAKTQTMFEISYLLYRSKGRLPRPFLCSA